MSSRGMTDQCFNMGLSASPSPGYQQCPWCYSSEHSLQPPYNPPPDTPPLPRGWTPVFDHQSDRWYYCEEATGKTQWQFPWFPTPMPMQGPPALNRDAYGAHAGHEQPGNKGEKDDKEKGSGMGGVAAAAVLDQARSQSSSSRSGDEEKHRHDSFVAPMAGAAPRVSQNQSPNNCYPDDDESDCESLWEACDDEWFEDYRKAMSNEWRLGLKCPDMD